MNKSRQVIPSTATPASPAHSSFLHSGTGQLTLAVNNVQSCKETASRILQRAAALPFAHSSQVNGIPSIVHEALNSPGQPLDAETRAYMEPRFGYDFSRVRVHTDTRAEESARSVNAQAYTVGSDIVFGAGAYSPSTHEGRQLVAHEMAHVVQQQAASQTNGSVQRRIVVDHPDQRPPRAPATATNASIINSYASTLCSGFSVDNSGVFHASSATYCTNAATTATPESCRCLCDMNSLRDTAGNDIEWKVFVADDKWPHTNIPSRAPQPGEPRRSVFIPSPYSGMQYGSWSVAPNVHRMTQDNWLVFGHELCGHGWLDERHLHPTTNVVADDARVTHDPTVAVENRIASEHGIPASEQRGLWATGGRHHGESLASVTIARYDFGRPEFTAAPPDERAKLDIVVSFMTAPSASGVMADVIGHADQPTATAWGNEWVSRERANNVKRELVGRGIAAGRIITTTGKAERECADPGMQPLCRKVAVYMFNYRAASDYHG